MCYFHNPSLTGSQQNPTKQDKTKHCIVPILSLSLSLSLSLVSNVVEWIKWVAEKFHLPEKRQPRLPQKKKKNKRRRRRRRKRRKQNDDQLSARFCCFWIFHGMTWRGEFVRPLLPMGKNPLLHLSEGFESVAEFSRFLSMGRKRTTSSIFFGASKSSSSAILTLLSLLLSGFIVVSRRLKCEI